MVKKMPSPTKRLEKLLKEALPSPDSAKEEADDLKEFRRAKFGSKGMASRLAPLGWHAAGRAALAANDGDLVTAESELAEAFRRVFWSRVVVQQVEPNTLAPLMLEAAVRGSGRAALEAIMRRILGQRGARDPLYSFARWALRLLEWEGTTPLFEDSPYVGEGAATTESTPSGAIVDVMCAWHLQVALRESGFSPFMFMPYIVLPVEVFAWVKRREQLGSAVPALDHPLLKTAIATVPLGKIDLAPKGHELIEPLLARCVKEGVLTSEQIAATTAG
ncbi:MAG: hypothetical protein IPM79_36215 [Polyangiaceae bacterium]|nr:hypothetical protein [Polyangiaceae bacterium]MBK8942900.1 hypothetical protein [Polyangiaceae bacterium]